MHHSGGVGGVKNGGGCGGGGAGVYGKSVLPLDFAVNLKLLLKTLCLF